MPPCQGLSLDTSASYIIRIQGRLDPSWSDRLGGVAIQIEDPAGKATITVLRGRFIDQAALAGVLSTLYDLGFPLLSVECVGLGHR